MCAHRDFLLGAPGAFCPTRRFRPSPVFSRVSLFRGGQNSRRRRQEKFLYICDTLHMWEWDVRVLDIQDGVAGEHDALCLGGRGAAPPEFCGGPTGYRLMLKRQREGAAMSDPVRLA